MLLAGVKYENNTITVDANMSRSFYEWIQAFMAGKAQRKGGAVIAADYNGKAMERMEFTNAQITEVGFPALDAASKDAVKMTIKIAPETTRRVEGGGQPTRPAQDSKAKKWLPANFRLHIDGRDDLMSRVNKIEALVVKQRVVEHAVSEQRDYEKEPEVPNLVITTAESYAAGLYRWHEDFVIKGNNGDDNQKNGELEFLAPDLKTVLFTLDLKHIGVFKVDPLPMSGGDAIRRVKAEMYVEQVALH